MTLSEQLKTVSPELAKRTGDFAADKIDVEISALVAKADNAGNHTDRSKALFEVALLEAVKTDGSKSVNINASALKALAETDAMEARRQLKNCVSGFTAAAATAKESKPEAKASAPTAG